MRSSVVRKMRRLLPLSHANMCCPACHLEELGGYRNLWCASDVDELRDRFVAKFTDQGENFASGLGLLVTYSANHILVRNLNAIFKQRKLWTNNKSRLVSE